MVAPVWHHVLRNVSTGENDWLPDYPNPADFRFDYYKLMSLAQQNNSGIGFAPSSGISVAIVGAGCAGMAAARELYRAGYDVTIYEASNRIGGRHWTVPAAGQVTGMELGAMRFPFFASPGAENSLFEYYLSTEAGAELLPFPNPGAAPDNTGIYMSQGYGPNDEFYPNRQMIIWPNDGQGPNDPYLLPVYNLVNDFITFFTNVVGGNPETNDTGLYLTPEWPLVWAQIADNYDRMSFSDLVFAPAITEYNDDGWFGGLGMNDAQSQIFYTIGSGDGSWGAFYSISAMWFIRCVMFGFESDLQTVVGPNDGPSLPFWNDTSLTDSNGAALPAPLYQGIQSLTEWLFYIAPPGTQTSMYSAVHGNDGPAKASMYVNRGVQSITYNDSNVIVQDSLGNNTTFDYVIVTPQIWAQQLSVPLQNFPLSALPQITLTARDEQHIIASAKVFFPLTEAYWKRGTIPQCIVTDTFLQDAYGVQWANDQGAVLLASYTWEDDALKLIPTSNASLAQQVLDELDNICQTTLGETISQYVTSVNDAIVFQWTDQPTYRGCAKLYRQRNWQQCYALLAYNQQYSSNSRLYVAGETFSVEGGWTEPALRSSLDAVIHLIQNSGGSFVPGFTFNDYPSFDTLFQPNEAYLR
jgi:monoamine oxidase